MRYDIRLGTRVVMGIPTTSAARNSPEWIDGMAGLQMPLGSSMGRKWTKDEPIAEARNMLCQAALEANAEYLFMLGDDVIPPPNTLLALLDRIGRIYPLRDGSEQRASMVTGIYWTKTYPPDPYIFRRKVGEDGSSNILAGPYKDWKAGEFFDIDFAGCDCLLIETSMLRKIPEPWFSTDWVWQEGQEISPIATEDYYFYTKAREQGFYLFADTGIQCLHEDRSTGAMFGLSMDMRQANAMPQDVADEVQLVADLGAGLATPTGLFKDNVKIVRFDMREDTKPDVRCDIRQLDPHWFGKFDYVLAHHVLEHFRRSEAQPLLAHWLQLLKPGGTIAIHVPNFKHAVDIILNPDGHEAGERMYSWAQIYGDQAQVGAPWQHLNGFTARKLEGLLKLTPGLSDVVVEEEHNGQNLKGTAKLTTVQKPYPLAQAWEVIVEKEAQPQNGIAEVEAMKGETLAHE